MKIAGPSKVEDSAGLFLLPECGLISLAAFKALIWFLWALQQPTAGNIGAVLAELKVLVLFAYLFITPVLGLYYLHRYYVTNIAVSGKAERPAPVSRRFWVQALVWLFLPGCVGVGIARGLSGDGPTMVGVKGGPDTTFARAGFESLLKRPIPEHVRGVYFQRQNSILDEHEILRFNTKDEEFIAALIRNYK